MEQHINEFSLKQIKAMFVFFFIFPFIQKDLNYNTKLNSVL